jgi:WD40 repeat protein
VVYIESLSNNNIIACCFDGALKIYEINHDDSKFVKQIEGHKNIVLKVLKINNKLISCSRDKTMKIWERNEHNIIIV